MRTRELYPWAVQEEMADNDIQEIEVMHSRALSTMAEEKQQIRKRKISRVTAWKISSEQIQCSDEKLREWNEVLVSDNVGIIYPDLKFCLPMYSKDAA